jgi:hypothetical protein
MSNKPPFTLPAVRVDRHVVKWWSVEGLDIVPCHAVYFVAASYEEVFGKPADGRAGVPVVDQWIVYRRGKTQGRNAGWRCWDTLGVSWWLCFGTEAAARAEVLGRCRRRGRDLLIEARSLVRKALEHGVPTALDELRRKLL